MADYFLFLLRTMEVIALLYALLILLYSVGWYLQKTSLTKNHDHTTFVSVLIAARNEELHIESLLNDLLHQDYPRDKFEIIIADDHSNDATAKIISTIIQENDLVNIKLLSVSGSGKKAALSEAILEAKGQFILVTDADCRLHPDWISTMTGIYNQQELKLLLGPVMIEPGTGIFGKLQSLEFMSLMGSTAGSCRIGLPSMANGANLGFDREIALSLDKEAFKHRYASGDDIFLLHAMLKSYGTDAVGFALHENAIVKTAALPTLKSFMQQRMRWVSKSRGYTRAAIIVPAVVVFFFNLALLLLLGMSFLFPFLFPVYLLLTLFKFMIDYPLLSGVSSFTKTRQLLIWALPLEVIYPFYVVIVAVAGNFSGINWKGRKIT